MPQNYKIPKYYMPQSDNAKKWSNSDPSTDCDGTDFVYA